MTFKVISEDITKLKLDAIVNAANTSLKMGGGVCGAIFRSAGLNNLKEACNTLAPIGTGEAVITSGFALPAKYIIHTAGPVYDPKDKEKSKKQLTKTYKSSLYLAKDNNIKSIAFPLISAGIYGYPKLEAYKIAKEVIEQFLDENIMDVFLTIIDQELLESIEVG